MRAHVLIGVVVVSLGGAGCTRRNSLYGNGPDLSLPGIVVPGADLAGVDGRGPNVDLAGADLGGVTTPGDLGGVGRVDLADYDGPCGAVGEPCCAMAQCSGGAFCNDGLCATCGGPGEACCPGGMCGGGGCCVAATGGGTCVASGSACGSNKVCLDGACGDCGGTGQACCADFTCSSLLPTQAACCDDATRTCVSGATIGGQSCGNGTCSNGSCGGCGGVAEQCCTSPVDGAPPVCSASGTVCDSAGGNQDATCQPCGTDKRPCCGGNTCLDGGCCVGGVCSGNNTSCGPAGGACKSGACGGGSCGALGQACCNGLCTAPDTRCINDVCNACGGRDQRCCTDQSSGQVGWCEPPYHSVFDSDNICYCRAQ